MLSRVAENIYWMGRYIERAENTARLVSVNGILLLDLPRNIAPGWGPLIEICGAGQEFYKRYKEPGERQVTKFLLADDDNPGSVLNALQAARENCRSIRDIVPREGWQHLNELHLFARENLHAGLTRRGRHEYLSRIIEASQTIAGLLAGTMNHDAGYQFLRAGRNLERADMTSRIIDVSTASLLPETDDNSADYGNIQWMSLLKSLSAYQMYRRTMHVSIRREAVLRFLFCNAEFPRALRHCVFEICRSLELIGNAEPALEILRGIEARLCESPVEQMEAARLHDFVDRLQLDLNHLHTAMAENYFLPPLEETGT